VRRPVWALHVFVVGLALHNLVMAELWDAGVRGTALDVVSAWKEALLAFALLLVVRVRRRVPFDGRPTDWLALAFGVLVVVYALLPFVHWLPAGAVRRRLLHARGFDDVLDPLGAKELASLFPYPVRVLNRGLTLVAVGPV